VSTWIALFIVAAAAMLLVQNHDGGTIAGLDTGTFAALAAGVALLIYLGSGFARGYDVGRSTMLRDALTWVALGLVLVTLYAYRGELLPIAGRFAGELLPGSAMVVEQSSGGPAEIKIRRRLDGHFTARTQVNGETVSMIVDTGASTIVLRPEDAAKAGIDLKGLSYNVPVITANGRTNAARVRLKTVAIGPLDRQKVDALVAQPGTLTESLLGMSFLSRLRSYEFSGDFLTLRG
jgi:aspartyl protease family protein